MEVTNEGGDCGGDVEIDEGNSGDGVVGARDFRPGAMGGGVLRWEPVRK